MKLACKRWASSCYHCSKALVEEYEEMLTSTSQLINTLGRGYVEAIPWSVLGGATGHYALGHLDISESFFLFI
jgi:hypothetical protein